MSNFDNTLIYVPEKNELVLIAEGSGDNLSYEDEEAGYVDYLMYDTYDCKTMEQLDGGQLMTTELVRDKYSALAEAAPDVLDFAYGSALEYRVVA